MQALCLPAHLEYCIQSTSLARGWTLPSLEEVLVESRELAASGCTTVSTPKLCSSSLTAIQQRKVLPARSQHFLQLNAVLRHQMRLRRSTAALFHTVLALIHERPLCRLPHCLCIGSNN